jgi:multidrug efflux pump subunit AcrA (membrane-fusion protein)
MYPASVCSGIVDRVHVQLGQSVSPGTLLASLTCDQNTATAVVTVSDQLAKSISRIERSTLRLNNQTITVLPRSISQEPTEGTLHTILFAIPDEVGAALTNGSIYPIQVPIGAIHATSSDPFVPIDALYQTQTDAYVYVASPSANSTSVASSKKVTIGTVFGEFIEVLTGLKDSDQVILNRNVIEGDLVTPVQ